MKSHSVTALVLSLVLLTGAGMALAPPQDDLELTSETDKTTPGNTATVELAVTNTGNETVGGDYTLHVNESTVPAGWQTNISNTTVVRGPLNPNETRATTLSVSVPENASLGETVLKVVLVSGDRKWANTTTAIRVVAATEETTSEGSDDGDDRAVDKNTENASGGGPPPIVAFRGGGSSYPWWWPISRFSPKTGLLGLAVVLGVVVVAKRIS